MSLRSLCRLPRNRSMCELRTSVSFAFSARRFGGHHSEIPSPPAPTWDSKDIEDLKSGISKILEHPPPKTELIDVFIVSRDFKRISVKAQVGETIVELAERERLDFPWKLACMGRFEDVSKDPFAFGPMCTSCHIYVAEEFLEKLPEKTNEELYVTEKISVDYYRSNSRLGCQFRFTPEMNGISIAFPENPEITVS